MTTVPFGYSATDIPFTTTWDAWDRLVRVQGGPNAIDIRYEYDGLHRRTRQLVINGTAQNLDFYYNEDWKIIEERFVASDGSVSTTLRAQYIYGIRARNDLVFRDALIDSNNTGTLIWQRHHATSDTIFSVTSIIDSTSTVQQRYEYTFSGDVSYMTSDFAITTNVEREWQIFYGCNYFVQGTPFCYNDSRCYAPEIGKWLSRNMTENFHDSNLYSFNDNLGFNFNNYSRNKSFFLDIGPKNRYTYISLGRGGPFLALAHSPQIDIPPNWITRDDRTQQEEVKREESPLKPEDVWKSAKKDEKFESIENKPSENPTFSKNPITLLDVTFVPMYEGPEWRVELGMFIISPPASYPMPKHFFENLFKTPIKTIGESGYGLGGCMRISF
jgi:YD repeat-containing protein